MGGPGRDIQSISIWNSPVLVARVFASVLFDALSSAAAYVCAHPVKCAATAAALTLAFGFFGLDDAALLASRKAIVMNGSFITYWVILGVLSSIGLGSGLHTFVLFLGPHIVRVANAAVVHNSTSFSAAITSFFEAPKSWDVAGLSEALSPTYASDAWSLPTGVARGTAPVTFGAIVAKVAWAGFLWGLGTALGELPPYFIARAARKTGQHLEELDAVAAAPASPLDKAKAMVFSAVQRYGFWAILAAASIPNPLFDLAGLTCGHFGIPFATFFGATLVGKAVIKVSIQAFGIIAAVKYGLSMFEALKGALPEGALRRAVSSAELAFLADQHAMCRREGDNCAACCTEVFASLGMEQCKGSCGVDAGAAQESLLKQAFSTLWGLFVVGMILYFVLSIVHAAVHDKLEKQAEDAAAAAAAASTRSGQEAALSPSPGTAGAGATPSRGRAAAAASPSALHGTDVISALMHKEALAPAAARKKSASGGSRRASSKGAKKTKA